MRFCSRRGTLLFCDLDPPFIRANRIHLCLMEISLVVDVHRDGTFGWFFQSMIVPITHRVILFIYQKEKIGPSSAASSEKVLSIRFSFFSPVMLLSLQQAEYFSFMEIKVRRYWCFHPFGYFESFVKFVRRLPVVLELWSWARSVDFPPVAFITKHIIINNVIITDHKESFQPDFFQAPWPIIGAVLRYKQTFHIL